MSDIYKEFGVDVLRDSENAGPTSAEVRMAQEIARFRAENIHLRRAGMDRPSAELHEAALAELRDQISNLRAEVLEQARLLGMSGEREAKLLARVEELTDALIDARHNGLIYWNPMTERGAVERAAMMARIDKVLNKEAKP